MLPKKLLQFLKKFWNIQTHIKKHTIRLNNLTEDENTEFILMEEGVGAWEISPSQSSLFEFKCQIR